MNRKQRSDRRPRPGAGPAAPAQATIIYACSGCSDAGEIADRAARTLTQMQAGQMSCLAGIGGRVRTLMGKAESAEAILVIDGCPLNCASKTLSLAGFNNFKHLELHRIGLHKGACPPTPERILAAVDAAARIIRGEAAQTDPSGVQLPELCSACQ